MIRRSRLIRLLLVIFFIFTVLFISRSQLDDEVDIRLAEHFKQIIEIPIELSAYARAETNRDNDGDDLVYEDEDQKDNGYILKVSDKT